MKLGADIAAPMIAPEIKVDPIWIDQNGHVNMANYLHVFDQAIDYFWRQIGLGPGYRASTNASTFTLQTQIHYIQEVRAGDSLRVEFRLVGFDHKRIHCFQSMFQVAQNYLAATEERMTLHVNMKNRRSAQFPDQIVENLALVFDSHKALPKDERIGSSISLER